MGVFNVVAILATICLAIICVGSIIPRCVEVIGLGGTIGIMVSKKKVLTGWIFLHMGEKANKRHHEQATSMHALIHGHEQCCMESTMFFLVYALCIFEQRCTHA
jgi:hypothetical protein